MVGLLISYLVPRQSSALRSIDASDDLKLLHWVHIPKAGGTAFTKLLKKVACGINPLIEKTSPCCHPELCLHSSSCHAAVGSCPLVTAIGRHSTNMALATAVPCCSTDLAMGTTASFLYFAFPKVERRTSNRAPTLLSISLAQLRRSLQL